MSETREDEGESGSEPQRSPLMRWLAHFADPIVFVTLITAVASVSFAYQTNRISQRQVELLNRQVAIEESLSLPVFTITVDPGADRGSSHRLGIHNSGGLANDLVIDVLPFVSYWWSEDDETGQVVVQGDELPLIGYFDEYYEVLPSRMLPGENLTLGFQGNATALHAVTDHLTAGLAAREGLTEIDYVLEILVRLRYIDYTGVERVDSYVGEIGSDGSVFPPRQFMRLDTAFGEEIYEDYFGKLDSQFFLVLDSETDSPGDDELQWIGHRIYDQGYIEPREDATPVAHASRRRAVSA